MTRRQTPAAATTPRPVDADRLIQILSRMETTFEYYLKAALCRFLAQLQQKTSNPQRKVVDAALQQLLASRVETTQQQQQKQASPPAPPPLPQPRSPGKVLGKPDRHDDQSRRAYYIRGLMEKWPDELQLPPGQPVPGDACLVLQGPHPEYDRQATINYSHVERWCQMLQPNRYLMEPARLRVGAWSATFGGYELAADGLTKKEPRMLKFLIYRMASDMRRFQRDLAVSSVLRHRFVVLTYQVLELEDATVLVQEFASHTLAEYIGLAPPPYWRKKLWMAQMADALDYLHDKHLVHGQIRPESVLVCQQQNIVKLTEFDSVQMWRSVEWRILLHRLGLRPGSVPDPPDSRQFAPVPKPELDREQSRYQAPELLVETPKRTVHDPIACDVFSLGVTYHLLLFNMFPFQEEAWPPPSDGPANLNLDTAEWGKLDIELEDLLKQMLDTRHRNRIRRIVSHRFFQYDANVLEMLAKTAHIPCPILEIKYE